MPRADVDRRRDELDNHERSNTDKHEVHHDVKGGAEGVGVAVQEAVVKHLLEAADVLGRAEQGLVQLGPVRPQRVHDDPVEGSETYF